MSILHQGMTESVTSRLVLFTLEKSQSSKEPLAVAAETFTRRQGCYFITHILTDYAGVFLAI